MAHLAVTFNGSSISAAINGTTVASVTDATYASGMVGFGTSGYQTDQFDNLSVTLAGSATPTGHIIAGDDTAECADVNGGSAADGTKVRMWDCDSNGAAQSWTMESNGTVGINGKCLDITGANYSNGTLIEEWTCNGGANQQWDSGQRRTGEPGVRQVPGRPGIQHHAGHPARPVVLQRRQ